MCIRISNQNAFRYIENKMIIIIIDRNGIPILVYTKIYLGRCVGVCECISGIQLKSLSAH